MLFFTVLAALVGLAGVFRQVRRTFPLGIAVTVIVLLVLATPLAWYSLFEPEPLPVAAFALTAWCAAGTGALHAVQRWPMLRTVAWLGIAAAPLGASWWMTRTQTNISAFDVSWSDVLFSSQQGFLSWTPVAYLGVVGTMLLVRREPVWAVVTLMVTTAGAVMLAWSGSWPVATAFGAMPLIPVLALLGYGLAALIDLLRRRPLLALAPLVALPIVWNHLLMVQYTIGMLPKDEPISFARMVRQQAELQTRTMPLYPFSFPANVWFAWREGVPVNRYDTLALLPRHPSANLAMDRSAEPFLLEGWSGPTAAGEGHGWWIGERRATIVLPLAPGEAQQARVTIAARSRFEEPTYEADLTVELNGREVGTFSPPATEAVDATFTVPASLLRDGLNKITIVSRGAHPVDPSDTRPPGPVARRASRSAWPVAVYRVAIEPR